MGARGVVLAVVVAAGALALPGCDDGLLPASRFAWQDPAQRAAGQDAASLDAGAHADAASSDSAAHSDATASDASLQPVADAAPGLPDISGDIAILVACTQDSDCLTLDDGDRCNGVWHCAGPTDARRCEPKPASGITCAGDKDTPCAASACVPKTGACVLKARPDGTDCDDGDGCTAGDACKGGVCQAGLQPACGCTQDVDCAGLDDGDACNGQMRCDKSAMPYKCAIDPATVVTCDPKKGTTCLPWTCAPQTGQCGAWPAPDGTACKSGGAQCSGTLACKAGKCMALEAKACDDGNACTVDGCDPESGCVFKSAGQDGKGCDLDGDLCGTADVCAGGQCEAGKAVDCDDGDPCTTDGCDKGSGACSHVKSGC